MNADEKTKSRILNLKSQIRLGCQGWNYPDWTTKADGDTIFYPRGTRSSEMLRLYARIFDTVEVDSTFYAIPAASALENWAKKTPPDFSFALKMPREITHERALDETSYQILDEFCERVQILGDKLKSVLVQLAPQFNASKENALNLRAFLARLPKEIRFAVEFRSREWLVDWTLEEFDKNRVALCLVEGAWLPREAMFAAIERPTADFAYVRFMGERDLTTFDRVVRPQDANLNVWAEELAKSKTKETYVYFSNFYEGFAPESVQKLMRFCGQQVKAAASLEEQASLF